MGRKHKKKTSENSEGQGAQGDVLPVEQLAAPVQQPATPVPQPAAPVQQTTLPVKQIAPSTSQPAPPQQQELPGPSSVEDVVQETQKLTIESSESTGKKKNRSRGRKGGASAQEQAPPPALQTPPPALQSHGQVPAQPQTSMPQRQGQQGPTQPQATMPQRQGQQGPAQPQATMPQGQGQQGPTQPQATMPQRAWQQGPAQPQATMPQRQGQQGPAQPQATMPQRQGQQGPTQPQATMPQRQGQQGPTQPQATMPQSQMQQAQSSQQQFQETGLIVPKRNPQLAGSKRGRPITIEVNYFSLSVAPKAKITHYDVEMDPDVKKLKMEIMQKFFRKYFPGRYPVFDGQKNMYSCGTLPGMPSGELDGVVEIIEQSKPRPFKVSIKAVANVDTNSLMTYMKSGSSQNAPMAAIQCVDVVLRYGALCRYVRVGRSVFAPPGRAPSLGGGYELWHGSYQSANLKWKPLLNFDIAHKGFPKQQSVIELCVELFNFDKSQRPLERWQEEQLQKFIRQLKVECAIPGQTASKRIFGVNDIDVPPNELYFDCEGRQITVLEYFAREKRYAIKYPNLPCLCVGAPKKDKKICYPLELCSVVGGQAVNRKLDGNQTTNMIKESAVKADVRKEKIMQAFSALNFAADPSLNEFGVKVGTQFEQVKGRVIPPPSLEYFGGKTETPRDGVWRCNRFIEGADLKTWMILCLCRVQQGDLQEMVELFKRVGGRNGMNIADPQMQMGDIRGLQESLMKALKNKMQLVMVVIDGKDEQYCRTKQLAELQYGVLTQCIKRFTVERKMNEATAQQLLLKMNSKLNNINHKLHQVPKCLLQPCMLLGADVTHPPPGLKQGDEPSVAAVVASHCKFAFKYNIAVRLQPSKAEIIEDLRSMVRSQLQHFRSKTNFIPKHIIMFRDGVSEGQFEQVLKVELVAIKSACSDMNVTYKPNITYIVVQKRHHTRFFPVDKRDGDRNMNVPVGTCIDTDITHPTEVDFYLLSHQSIKGTARPTKYHKLWDDANMTDTELEELAFYLCHMYTRCTRSVSYPAPTYYAHLAAARAKVYTDGVRINMGKLHEEQSKIQVREDILNNAPMFFV